VLLQEVNTPSPSSAPVRFENATFDGRTVLPINPLPLSSSARHFGKEMPATAFLLSALTEGSFEPSRLRAMFFAARDEFVALAATWACRRSTVGRSVESIVDPRVIRRNGAEEHTRKLSIYDTYMNCYRGELTSDEMFAEFAMNSAVALTMLTVCPLDVAHTLDLLAGIAHGYDTLRAAAGNLPLAPLSDCEILLEQIFDKVFENRRAVNPMATWKFGHQGFGWQNLLAGSAIDHAKVAYTEGRFEDATKLLEEATIHVNAITGAMFLTESMTPFEYCEIVRPSMAPPNVPFELAGMHNTDHAVYRLAINELVKAMPEAFDELVAVCPQLASARTSLLNADLSDIDQHRFAAVKLIGDARSLNHHRSERTASEVLRDMYLSRLADYAPYMPHPPKFAQFFR
jgi:hypothetical protein